MGSDEATAWFLLRPPPVMPARAIVALMGGQATLHSHIENFEDLLNAVKDGLPLAAFRKVAEAVGVDDHAFADALRVLPADGERLTVDESDRLVRFADIFAKIQYRLRDATRASEWLKQPNAALGHRRPIDLIDVQPGVSQIEQLINDPGAAVL